jgi:hypothetical protein
MDYSQTKNIGKEGSRRYEYCFCTGWILILDVILIDNPIKSQTVNYSNNGSNK